MLPFRLVFPLTRLDAVQRRKQVLDRFFKIVLRVPEPSSTLEKAR